jgi:oligopeptidase B
VLDITEVPFIPPRLLRKTLIDGFKISDDHSLIAFKLDIGNTEKITTGFKDMNTGQVLKTKLTNVGDIIFGCGRTVFYTECDTESNRPYKVVRLDVKTGQSSTVFMDDNPTHYVDIGLTKDKKYIVINSNTKEDSEVWVAERTENSEETVPRKLIQRVKGVQSHIDHLRDFFVTITTLGTKQKRYKICTLKDGETEWKDLLPFEDPTLVISEFDCFHDFFALYTKKNGVPEIII